MNGHESKMLVNWKSHALHSNKYNGNNHQFNDANIDVKNKFNLTEQRLNSISFIIVVIKINTKPDERGSRDVDITRGICCNLFEKVDYKLNGTEGNSGKGI